MYWFSGAPKLEGPDNAEEVTRFIDLFITTSGDDPEIHEVIQYQRHKHSASCLRELRGRSRRGYGNDGYCDAGPQAMRNCAEVELSWVSC